MGLQLHPAAVTESQEQRPSFWRRSRVEDATTSLSTAKDVVPVAQADV